MAYGDVLVGSGVGARYMEVQGGPSWLDRDLYDILAKSENADQPLAPLLQTLLVERFHVRVHREARDSQVYTLKIASGGSKLEPMKEGSCVPADPANTLLTEPKPGEPLPRICGFGSQRLKAGMKPGTLMVADWYGMTMAEVAGRMLRGMVDLPVVDQTGLSGRFDIHLEFVHPQSFGENSSVMMLNGVPTAGLNTSSADPAAGPSVVTALEKQLGLKLSRGKAPVEYIVVDGAEKPTAN